MKVVNNTKCVFEPVKNMILILKGIGSTDGLGLEWFQVNEIELACS